MEGEAEGGCPPWEQSEGAATLPGARQGPLIPRKEVKMSCSKQAVGKKARAGERSGSVWTENWPRGRKNTANSRAKKNTTVSCLHCILRVSPGYYMFFITVSDYKILHLMDTQ